MIKYSLVIPFFNEEKNIQKVIEALVQISKKIKFIEFILVNNGSTDNSKIEFEKGLMEKNKKIFKLKNIKQNIGYGHGIKYGLSKSKGNYVAWTHSDLQTDPKDIMGFIKIIENLPKKQNLFIKGLRKKIKSKESFQTKAMEFISSYFLGINVRDINAQPKLMTKFFFTKYIKKFAPNDLSFDLFCYSLAVYKKVRIYEFDVFFKKRKYGDVKGGGEGGSIFSKLKVIFATFKCLIYLKFLKI
ncbi:glycosyltransferase family 2 protein [Candidatus Pelagibacter bacterium]|nr:glycosyltransferase family 2 protein [Candidatus Pelagibacter bacterium]|tara:strand:- start:2012 stop:2740 length:729 start_codon:yes stop_codon:yes gene_type:complete